MRLLCSLLIACNGREGLGDEGGDVVAGHDDHDARFHFQRDDHRLLGRAWRRGVFLGRLVASASKHEECYGDETHHCCHTSEEIREWRTPWLQS